MGNKPLTAPDAPTPLWRLGFRPFFLLGSLFAALALLAWALALRGASAGWQPLGGVLAWHRHEMIFGFSTAIIAGFLLTAVQNWTGRPGLQGRALMALVSLWASARLAWLAALPLAVTALLDLAFLPAVAWIFARQLLRARQWHNFPMVGLLLLLSACNGLTFYGLAQADDALQRRGILAALWLVASLIGLIAGRVLPFFTQRGLNLPTSQQLPVWLDVFTLLLGLSVALALAGDLDGIWLGLTFAALSGIHLYRLCHWYAAGVWRLPLLWSLYLAYAWIPIGSLLLALHYLQIPLMASLGHHALAVGSLGGMILAMMARVSLGHTGRPLKAPQCIAIAFALVHLATLTRVLVPLLGSTGLALAATAWIAAFSLFVLGYGRLLMSPRADGLPG